MIVFGSVTIRLRRAGTPCTVKCTICTSAYVEKYRSNVASIQVQKVSTYNSNRKKNNFNSKQIIQIIQPIIIDNLDKVNISFDF